MENKTIDINNDPMEIYLDYTSNIPSWIDNKSKKHLKIWRQMNNMSMDLVILFSDVFLSSEDIRSLAARFNLSLDYLMEMIYEDIELYEFLTKNLMVTYYIGILKKVSKIGLSQERFEITQNINSFVDLVNIKYDF